MKKYMFLISMLMPAISIAMEEKVNPKPTITMAHEFDSLLEKCRYPRTISHIIDIPEEGAIFELSSKLLRLHPKHTKLDIEKGTKSITISESDNRCGFNITDNNSRNLAKICILRNPK